FSSRRRHTRFSRDWSSDVCSSDLMSPMSAEATVVRNYVDWLVKAPWKKKTKVLNDINLAEKVLDEDHYGLEKVKERIVEYLAVRSEERRVGKEWRSGGARQNESRN